MDRLDLLLVIIGLVLVLDGDYATFGAVCISAGLGLFLWVRLRAG